MQYCNIEYNGIPTASSASPVQPDGNVDTMMLYLRKARARALAIRANAPAGSYMESVLKRTISGIDQELSHLGYLLAKQDLDSKPARMRPAI